MSVYYNGDEKNNGFLTRASICEELSCPSRSAWVFYGDSRFLPHPRTVCAHEGTWCVSTLSLSEWVGCVWVVLRWRVFHLGWVPVVPWAARTGSGHLWPWAGELGVWKTMILLVFIHLPWMYAELTFISVFNIKSVLGLCLEICWLEKCDGNQTLISVN